MIAQSSILIAGASGYVGGRFLQTLETQNKSKRVLTASEASDIPSLRKALKGIHTAFYFEKKKPDDAKRFAHACSLNKVKRIVYVGTMNSSPKVGEILMASAVPMVEFRPSFIIGSGSPPFEAIRAWVERFPIMIEPPWIDRLTQPLSIEDMMAYLLEATSYRGPSRVFEIGGPERVSYREMIKEMSRQGRLRRWMFSVPFLSPWLFRSFLRWSLAVDPQAIRTIEMEMRSNTVVSHPDALRLFQVRPRSCEESIAHALEIRGNRSRVS